MFMFISKFSYWDYKLYIECHLTVITNKFVLIFFKDWHFMEICISTLLLRTSSRDLYVCTCVPHPAATLIGLFRRFLRIWYARVIYFAHCSNDSSITCCTLSSPRHAEPDIRENLERQWPVKNADKRSIHLCCSDMHFTSFTFAVSRVH